MNKYYVHCNNKLNWHYQSDNYTYRNKAATFGGIGVLSLGCRSWIIKSSIPDLDFFFMGDLTCLLIPGKVFWHVTSGVDSDDVAGRDDDVGVEGRDLGVEGRDRSGGVLGDRSGGVLGDRLRFLDFTIHPTPSSVSSEWPDWEWGTKPSDPDSLVSSSEPEGSL